MSTLNTWVKAARLRTLPLSVSGILVGTGLASLYGTVDYVIFAFSMATTISFQITSNFANDFGDGIKGTDNTDRVGPARVLQSGLLSARQLKTGIYVSVFINLVFTIILILTAFGLQHFLWSFLFLCLGAVSIWAAIRYTVGKSAYGYQGLGDVFVFVFFGLVGVLGSLFLQIKTITPNAILPAMTIGLLSVGVLNLNNLRDNVPDKIAGKNTLIVKIGYKKGKIYHYLLLLVSFLCLFFFMLTTNGSNLRYVSLAGYVPVVMHLIKVAKTEEPKNMDPELKKLALCTFLTAVLFLISCCYFCNFNGNLTKLI